MAKKRKKKTPQGTPVRVKLLATILVIVTVAGIASVKFFDTTRGRVILLDAGITDYYSQVQEELEGSLRIAVRSLGMIDGLEVRVEREKVGSHPVLVRRWVAQCHGDCSPARIGLAFTKAARGRGAKAHSSVVERNDGGHNIIVAVGSRRFVTHRVEVRSTIAPAEPATTPHARPRLALVIDDFGYSRSNLIEAFLALDLPLTIAVIPSLPRTEYAIQRAKERHKQPILHVPMEADDHDFNKPSVMTAMTEGEIRALVTDYLDRNPGVVGINNHMGSKATRDPRVMEAVTSVLKSRGLFFLDSLTSPKSVAYNTAKSMNVPTARNDLFLDYDTEDQRVVEERLLSLIEMAQRKGSAVGIGHPKPWTYEAIKRSEGALRKSGVELVFVSELME